MAQKVEHLVYLSFSSRLLYTSHRDLQTDILKQLRCSVSVDFILSSVDLIIKYYLGKFYVCILFWRNLNPVDKLLAIE